MKILEIRERSVPFQTAIRNAVVDFSQMTASVVAIVTDQVRDGRRVIGYGFNSIGRYGACEIIRDRLVPRLVQAGFENLLTEAGDNLDPFKMWAAMTRNEKPGGHGDRAHAVGAVDMAAWDAVAKIAGVPLWKHLSDTFNHGAHDERVFTYAAGGYYHPGKGIEGLRGELASYLERGFTAVKIKIGGAPLDEDMARLQAAIDVVGRGAKVAVDANGRFDLDTALAYGRALAPYGPMWYEEPGDPLDYRLNATLAEHYPGPLATGENLFAATDHRNLLRYGGLRPDRDYVQFDCGLSYGLVEYLRSIETMRAHGWSPRRLIPHGGHQMCLNIAAGLQLGGNECYPDVFQPFGGFADAVPVVDGFVGLPDIPGIGFEAKENLYAVMRQVAE